MSEEQAAARAIFGEDLTVGINALPRTYENEAIEQRCGRLAHFILDQKRILLAPEQRLLLLQQIARAALQAGWQLKRHAQGDWRPDPDAARFPAYEEPKPPAVTFDIVYEVWCQNENPAPSSRKNRKTLLASFARSLGHTDMARVTEEDVLKWRAVMLKDGRAPSTVKVALDNAKAHFAYARGHRMIPANPFLELKLTIKAENHPAKTEAMVGYSLDEIARLLRLSTQQKSMSRRWLPLLSATTGARISELAQLWGSRVVEIEGIWTLLIRPAEDGGRLKNRYAIRDVPLHPAVIEAGFLDFVRSRGSGPLFYDKITDGADPNRKHVSTWVGSALGTWIRAQGFADRTKAPNHACRHFFKTVAHKVGVDPIVANFLQGHRTPGEATRYRHVGEDRAGLYRAVCAIPIRDALALNEPQRLPQPETAVDLEPADL
ncbi:hypothetical protein EBB05_18420 [Methylobacterium brachiatum]|nr:hypothetical protein EBB05_18420 [Methylobacterium brachiatum]